MPHDFPPWKILFERYPQAKPLFAMGQRHKDYNVTPEMFGWVGECLLATLAEIAGPQWSPEIAQAWTDAYGAISGLMLEAYKP